MKEDRTIGRIVTRRRPFVLFIPFVPQTTGDPTLDVPSTGDSALGGRPVPDRSLDGRRARGDKTRSAILARAMQIASAEGLDGLSLGRLAGDLGMSKSGLFAHFGSKEELQLMTLRAAAGVFIDLAVTPAQELPEGIVRLAALTDTWLKYLDGETFEGGCPFIAAAAEFDSRPGPVRDLIAEMMGRWLCLLIDQARAAQEGGELVPGADPEGLAWELHAFGLALNWDRRLNGTGVALERARAAARDRLRAAATVKGRRRLSG
jgi:AcrR family transcriptional regulator